MTGRHSGRGVFDVPSRGGVSTHCRYGYFTVGNLLCRIECRFVDRKVVRWYGSSECCHLIDANIRLCDENISFLEQGGVRACGTGRGIDDTYFIDYQAVWWQEKSMPGDLNAANYIPVSG